MCTVEFNVLLDTHYRLFRGRIFSANHLAMVLTKQTYNNQDKHKKPKDYTKKHRKLKNLEN